MCILQDWSEKRLLVMLTIMNFSTQAVTIGVFFTTALEINGMCNY